jgi:putative transposase
MLVEKGHPDLTIRQQCRVLELERSSFYYRAEPMSPETQRLMRLIDEEYTRHPFFGSRQLTHWLRKQGHRVNRKRVQRLMRIMGLEAIAPKRNLSLPQPGNQRFPYLLNGLDVDKPDQVWAADITYIRMQTGFAYLVAIMDWHSRYVLSWKLSTTLDADFCLEALERALEKNRPEIFNTDQGCQFTCKEYIHRLQKAGIRISQDGKGRALDNIYVERLWRSVKYEDVYLKDYQTVQEARQSLETYFAFYNHERPHQSLGGRTPAEVYFAKSSACVAA